MPKTKVCTKCEEKLPATTEYFYKAKENKDGLQSMCKICNNEKYGAKRKSYYADNKDFKKEYQKAYYNKNRIARLKYAKEYKINNQSKIAQREKIYRDKNKEKSSIYQKKYRISNKAILSEKQKEYWVKHKLEKREYNRKYREINKEYVSQYHKQYRSKNIEKLSMNKKIYVKENKNKIAKYTKEKYSKDLRFKLRCRMSTAIWRSLNGNKNSHAWEKLVGYTTQELVIHLEKQFKSGMTWENYGVYGWHIDHKKPIASFNFKSLEDAEFKECWSLDNLQPLWAEENLKKNSYWNGIKYCNIKQNQAP